MSSNLTLYPGLRKGVVSIPPSKSHLHRLMIADFLTAYQNHDASHQPFATADTSAATDILATQACLDALKNDVSPTLPCHESGSTLRFLLPIAMTCRHDVLFTAEGRLPQRPIAPFLELLAHHGVNAGQDAFPLHLTGTLQPGTFTLPGDISSQIITGLLFALPMLEADSVIRLTSPMESRGYVEMTLQVLRAFRIDVAETQDAFHIPGRQHYCAPTAMPPEPDWSGAAFWLAMNHLGSRIDLPSMPMASRQPDRQICSLLPRLGTAIDVAQCPDIFPVLAVAAAATHGTTVFTGVKRLRLKESDRLAAMADLLGNVGVSTDNEVNRFTVHGIGRHLRGNATINPRNDHRIAMAAAVAATVAEAPVTILQPNCIQKSYPDFFRQFQSLLILA